MPGRRRLPRAHARATGLPAAAVEAFLDGIEAAHLELHSLMVVHRGSVVAEGWWAPYSADRPHQLFSLSKSFTATAVGLAQHEGLLSIDDLVLDHLGELAPPEPSPNLARMRIRHLLSMTTGHHDDVSPQVFATQGWTAAFLAEPVEHEPGTHFVYNTAATYVLSAIVQRVTGLRVLDYLGPLLLEPLGITGATWERSPEGIDTGGFGLALTTEDIACYGQLMLADGVWQGHRVLPDGWVAQASAPQGPVPGGDSDWAQGYGFQHWVSRHGYRGDGAFGQFCVVLPEQDAVVAMTAGVADMQAVLDVAWSTLLPGFDAPEPDGAGSDTSTADDRLAERLSTLRLAPPEGQPTDVAGPPGPWVGRTIVLDANDHGISAIRIEQVDGGSRIEVTRTGGSGVAVDAGYGTWTSAVMAIDPDPVPWHRPVPSRVVAVAAAWPTPSTFTVVARFVETPFAYTATACCSDDDKVTVDLEVSVAFGPTDLGRLVGRLAPL
ncbi:MAG: serine hydrolase [Cellulomonadaceae bacterium]|nr:serine hydrolase [Cellulomonadaceae bacterium]